MPTKGISPSALAILRTCAQKYDFRYNQKLISGPVHDAARFGTLWHKIMEIYVGGPGRNGWQEELKPVSLEEIVGLACEEVKWEDPSDPKQYRTREKALLGLNHYVEKWGDNKYQPVFINGKPATESEVVIDVNFIDEPLHVIRDLLATWNANENEGVKMWNVDYKTASRLELNWVQTYTASDQFKEYTFASREQGYDVAGTICDLFRVTKGAKAGKTAAERDGCMFWRLPIHHSDFVIDRWRDGLIASLEARDRFRALDMWPTNAPLACTSTYCEYLNLCAAENEELYEAMLKTYQRDTYQDPRNAKLGDEEW